MAKFLKSLFHPSAEKKRNSWKEGDEDNRGDSLHLDIRRKLSISRSGRMKQNKKRRSLNTDFFVENLHLAEKPVSTEYHVHGKAYSQAAMMTTSKSTSDLTLKIDLANEKTMDNKSEAIDKSRIKTPEEEIENAFKIIDNET